MGIIKKGGWTLVKADGTPVEEGAEVVDFRGDTDVVVGGTPPHKEGSTGRVHTKAGAEFFPGVFDLKWVEEVA